MAKTQSSTPPRAVFTSSSGAAPSESVLMITQALLKTRTTQNRHLQNITLDNNHLPDTQTILHLESNYLRRLVLANIEITKHRNRTALADPLVLKVFANNVDS